ncbi:MAG: hypothetical protein V1702_00390 [Candidatus Woesearchaeota archaeon]
MKNKILFLSVLFLFAFAVAAAACDEPPLVSITVPSTALNGSQITVPITASDDHGVFAILLLDAEGSILGSYHCYGNLSCSANFMVHVPSACGVQYTFKAKAYDTAYQIALASGSGVTYCHAPPVDNFPTVAIDVPSTALAGSQIIVPVTASDDKGVYMLQLLDSGGAVLGSYNCGGSLSCAANFLVNVPSGVGMHYTFKAKAFDTVMQFSTATGSGVTYCHVPPVDDAPVVAINVPSAALIGSQITVPVTASDDNGVSAILFLDAMDSVLGSYHCGGSLSCSTSFLVYVPSVIGEQYTFKAKAFDTIGQHAVASGSGVTYDYTPPEPDAAPTASISVPSTALNGSQITVPVTASDDNGVSSVQLLDGGNNVLASYNCAGSLSCSTSFMVYVPSAVGASYTFKAKATDTAGQIAIASGSGVTYGHVIPPVDNAPVVSISVPATALNGSSITVPVAASDDKGVSLIQFLDSSNNVLAIYNCTGILTCSANFVVSVPSANNTVYTFKAKAIDTAGQFAGASGSGVTVAAPVIVPPAPPVHNGGGVPAPVETEAELLVMTFVIENADFIKDGDIIRFFYIVENKGEKSLNEITFSASIPELGIKAPSLRAQQLKAGSSISKMQYIELPAGVKPGTYYLQLSINSRDARRVVYREFIVNA